MSFSIGRSRFSVLAKRRRRSFGVRRRVELLLARDRIVGPRRDRGTIFNLTLSTRRRSYAVTVRERVSLAPRLIHPEKRIRVPGNVSGRYDARRARGVIARGGGILFFCPPQRDAWGTQSIDCARDNISRADIWSCFMANTFLPADTRRVDRFPGALEARLNQRGTLSLPPAAWLVVAMDHFLSPTACSLPIRASPRDRPHSRVVTTVTRDGLGINFKATSLAPHFACARRVCTRGNPFCRGDATLTFLQCGLKATRDSSNWPAKPDALDLNILRIDVQKIKLPISRHHFSRDYLSS